MPTKFSIKKVQGVYYFTDILNPFAAGTMKEIYSNEITDSITIKAYKIYHGSTTYLLKVLTCHKGLVETLDQARTEFKVIQKLSQESSGIAVPIDIKEWEDPENGEVHIEMLFEYGGDPLTHSIKKLSIKDLLNVVRKTLAPLALLEKNGIFCSDIQPHNLVINKDGVIKVIDFGVSKELNQKTVLLKALSAEAKIKSGTLNYLPPEVIQKSGNYILGKINVYCWGMVMYQLITGKTVAEMCEELETFKVPGKDYAGFLKNLDKVKVGDAMESFQTNIFINVLKQVLSFNPAERPTFNALSDIFGQKYEQHKIKVVDDVAAAELRATKEMLAKSQEELNACKTERSNAESSYKKVQTELTLCQEELFVVKMIYEEEKNKHEIPTTTFNYENETLKKDLAQLKDDLGYLGKKYEESKKEVEILTKRLSELQSENKALKENAPIKKEDKSVIPRAICRDCGSDETSVYMWLCEDCGHKWT